MQTSTCLQPAVVVATVVRALPNVVVVVPLPNVAALVFVSSLQSSFMMHTSWRQLEEELDVLKNIDELELELSEFEEDEVRRKEELVEGLELSTEDDVNEEDVDEDDEESVRDNEEELDENDISTLEDESGEDNEDRVEDFDELVDEGELWALEEELSTLLEDEEEHDA